LRILLIEDDAETAAYVLKGLREEGHVVDLATDGVHGLHQATENSFDLLIVDRMLPGLDGVAVVKALRAAGYGTPVLFLSALGAVQDRVDGLDAGGDDYLGKPFSFAELRARVNALARRQPLQETKTELNVGGLRMDLLKRTVQFDGDLIELQPREYQLLEFLMANAGRVVTRTMLLESIWDFRFDPGTNIVETHICRLRAKIERGGGRALIRTVRGAGYMLSDQ
jgi:two-component system, OmpR family, response regulator